MSVQDHRTTRKTPVVSHRGGAYRFPADGKSCTRERSAGRGVLATNDSTACRSIHSLPGVRDRTGLSRSTIWRLERRRFPKHRQLSANAVGWLEAEIDDWVRSRAANG